MDLKTILSLIEVGCFALFTILYAIFVIRWLFLNKKEKSAEDNEDKLPE